MRHFLANVTVAAAGLAARPALALAPITPVLKEWTQIFMWTATGVWFCVQIALAIEKRFRLRDDGAPGITPIRPLKRRPRDAMDPDQLG